ncbi:MAG: 3-dehydroquinate synthase [Nitrososphaeria archaeon]
MIKGKFSKITIGRGILDQISSEIRSIGPSKVCIITNRIVSKNWLDKVLEAIHLNNGLETIEIGDGERYKNITTATYIWRRLLEKKFTRKSLLIALGGGVVGDLAGFVASTFMRGIYFSQVPTTLLAQVDSGIGGKTGINFKGKNTIGTFYQPKFILVDTQFLDTLPNLEYLNGLAEVVKYGVIRDVEFFKFLENNVGEIKAKDQLVLQKIVKRCVEMKVSVVEADERETGLRMILNFGHTFGHSIEKLTNYRLRHGFAVSIGMMMASKVATEITGFHQLDRLESLLKNLGLPTSTKLDLESVVKETSKDKKAWYGKTVLVLPERIGKVTINEVEQKDILRILRK